VNTAVYDVRTYRTANGYMDQKTFVDVMVDVFIPHVEEVRRSVKGNKHALLLVGGHISRYSVEGLNILRDPVNDIDLVILPAHTSHVAQPMDLGLNHYFKLFFRQEWPKAKPIIPFVPPQTGRPSKLRRSDTGSCTVSQIVKETVEEAEARASRAVYRRAKVVHAAMEAIVKACTPTKIRDAFKQAHLVPLLWDPPYTREKEEKLLKEAEGMNITVKETTERQKEHIVGIVTSDAAIEKIKARPDLVQTGGHKRGRRSSVAKPPVPVRQTENSDDTAHKRGRRSSAAKSPVPVRQTKTSDDTAHSGCKRRSSAATKASASLATSDTDDSCQTSETGKTKRKTDSKGR